MGGGRFAGLAVERGGGGIRGSGPREEHRGHLPIYGCKEGGPPPVVRIRN